MNPLTPSLHPSTKLALLQSLRRQKAVARGFTLIELMITVAIVGVLAAVALPRFLGTRDAAAAGAAIGEKVGLAKECATYVASGGVGEAPSVGGACSTATGGLFTATWSGSVTGVKCLGKEVGSSPATITVTTSGTISCN